MGDRGNVFFVDRRAGKQLTGIYMYTHWSGSLLPTFVRAALKRGQGRWGDSQYLARIVFCELVQESVMDETGYGLSTTIGDNEHAIVRVDDTKQRVSFHVAGDEQDPRAKGSQSWSYEEYVAMTDAALLSTFLPAAEDEVELPVAKVATRRKRAATPNKPVRAKKTRAGVRRNKPPAG